MGLFRSFAGWSGIPLLAVLAACTAASVDPLEDTAAVSCPQGFGWAEGLPGYFVKGAKFPTAFNIAQSKIPSR